MSRSLVTSALVIATLVASPALAQRQRHPGGGGGEGGWQRGGAPAQERGGRPAPPPQGGGNARGEAQGRGGRPGGYEPPRQYAAPPPEYRQPQQQSGYRGSGDTGRYAVPRDQASGNRYGAPGYPGGPRPVPPYQSPGYANRGYSGRYVDPGYNRGYYNPGRSYAVPRPAPRYYAYGSYRGYAHVTPRYYAPRGYVSPYWHGGWAGGWGGVAVVAPRYIYPSVISYGVWQPYAYRPSLGLGIYYGTGGLYPFGTIPPAFYDPTPGIAYGGLRIVDAPRDAQVFADGYYVGIVDDFDGAFQHLNLEPGPHRIEIHHPGFAPVTFDVDVQPGRTITLRADVY
ncbi:hypothetical protein TBR22_A01700 [Luteitalea sp. TBR-22]|uniref:carboxypeptidase-like regulatory domain-containing protein n=1 Tax=Luteitalea sp. TBR-22 TaxID=2802971 RepID=UPI001AFCB514|nr:carboxypeptidase-like regulatory domain-containing protein [Luteitalea sp. TBR-22]BCS30969.1 hypothetical protein TBR22_A01700 [Luteitalea sp. TBR-22]